MRALAGLLGDECASLTGAHSLCPRSIRDPRFEDTSGKLNSRAFAKRYGFVYDEVMAGEAADLKAALKVHAAVRHSLMIAAPLLAI